MPSQRPIGVSAYYDLPDPTGQTSMGSTLDTMADAYEATISAQVDNGGMPAGGVDPGVIGSGGGELSGGTIADLPLVTNENLWMTELTPEAEQDLGYLLGGDPNDPLNLGATQDLTESWIVPGSAVPLDLGQLIEATPDLSTVSDNQWLQALMASAPQRQMGPGAMIDAELNAYNACVASSPWNEFEPEKIEIPDLPEGPDADMGVMPGEGTVNVGSNNEMYISTMQDCWRRHPLAALSTHYTGLPPGDVP